jgi:hypothetical protein
MTRQQLASKAGVCIATFNKWIRKDLPTLKRLGYRPRSVLNPALVRFLCQKYCIDV